MGRNIISGTLWSSAYVKRAANGEAGGWCKDTVAVSHASRTLLNRGINTVTAGNIFSAETSQPRVSLLQLNGS